MKIHCDLNKKPTAKPQSHKKYLRVEFINNGGYWAKWYEVYDTNEAKELFAAEYPNGTYCRSKTY